LILQARVLLISVGYGRVDTPIPNESASASRRVASTRRKSGQRVARCVNASCVFSSVWFRIVASTRRFFAELQTSRLVSRRRAARRVDAPQVASTRRALRLHVVRF
jgi:hypothetical protein